MRFLLTNDDGIYAPGLAAIKEELEKIGEVTVVAPYTEQSAAGHSLTIWTPLRVIPVKRSGVFYGWAITGTPADCVKLGISCIMEEQPDVVVSGINPGANTGINVIYSGTVSAATEALIMGCTGIALSAQHELNPDYRVASIFGARLARILAERQIRLPYALNVNCPDGSMEEIKGVRITRQGRTRIHDEFIKRETPRGAVYYWQAATNLIRDNSEDSDEGCLRNRMISITPIHYNLDVQNFSDELLNQVDLEKLIHF